MHSACGSLCMAEVLKYPYSAFYSPKTDLGPLSFHSIHACQREAAATFTLIVCSYPHRRGRKSYMQDQMYAVGCQGREHVSLSAQHNLHIQLWQTKQHPCRSSAEAHPDTIHTPSTTFRSMLGACKDSLSLPGRILRRILSVKVRT